MTPIDTSLVEFVVGVHSSILRVTNANDPTFMVEMQDGDDVDFHIDIIKKVAKVLAVKALVAEDDGEIAVYIKGEL